MISFIIPTKNEEKIIEKTLGCILKYNGEKEIIVSDGGSIDNTILITNQFTDKVIRYSGKARQTIAQGRNDGAKIANGEYLVFIDADMYFEDPNVFFKKAIHLFEVNSNLVGLTVKLKVLPKLETLADKIIFSIVNSLYYLQNNILGIGVASGEFQMIKSDVFKKIGGYNELLPVGEDLELFKRLAKVGKTRYENSLVIYHTGRRAHTIGWPKLLYIWIINIISIFFIKKSAYKEWKEIR